MIWHRKAMTDARTPTDGELAKRRYRDESQIADPRSPFRHDRDRIIHCTAFRRLQYKTQVYVIHEGDLYRTRLTHSLEVAQIAMGLAQSLEADGDLAEAIALAHDLGHAPFGHSGEETVRHLMEKHGIPFDHNIQSYRIVSELEERYTNFKGLNLTYATLEGILRHFTYFDKEESIRASIPRELQREVAQFWSTPQPTLEAQTVNVADIIAYAAHDIEDALEVGLLNWDEFYRSIEKYSIAFMKELIDHPLAESLKEYQQRNGDTSGPLLAKMRNRTLSRLIIDKLIRETTQNAKANLVKLNKKRTASPLSEEIRMSPSAMVALPGALQEQVKILVEDLLFNRVYREPRVVIMSEKGRRILQALFETFMRVPAALPTRTQCRLVAYYALDEKQRRSKRGQRMLARVVADYISGMTDKYAMDMYQTLTQAYEKAL
jgi:dGTPase